MSLQYAHGQSSLSFDKDRPSSRDRNRRHPGKFFFCLKPAAFAARRMNRDAEHHARDRTRRAACPPDLLHMTLLYMGKFDEPPRGLVPFIHATVGKLAARPIKIDLDGSALFGGKRHLVLTSSGANCELRMFVRMLRNMLTKHNLPRSWLGSFEPHVTVIYNCGKIDLLPVDGPHSWIAEEFLLVYSHHGKGQHEEFGRWRFDPAAPPYPTPPEQLRWTM